MDAIKTLLTTSQGRISRKHWWLGILCLFVIAAVVSALAGVLGTFIPLFSDPDVIAWLAVLLNLALLYFAYCIGMKRRHDRNNKGLDFQIYIIGSLVLNILQASKIGTTPVVDDGVTYHMPTAWLAFLSLLFFAYSIYMFIQLGFLKGSSGPNNYGPDPLDGAA